MENKNVNKASEDIPLGEFDKTIRRPTSEAEIIESSQNIVEKDQTCQLCQKRYQRPRMLKCLHVACTRCLEKTSKTLANTMQIQCYICKGITTLPPGGVLDYY